MKHNQNVHKIMQQVRDIESLKRYGFDDSEIMELQDLKAEGNHKVKKYKVSL